MLSHSQIWQAIDALAARHGLSPSGLARRAGLDPTVFNRSKRVTRSGRLRWPSTESIAKILNATDTSLEHFAGHDASAADTLPVALLSDARQTLPFDAHGAPRGSGWQETRWPTDNGAAHYGLRIDTDDLLPAYPRGTLLVVRRASHVMEGERIILQDRSDGLLVQSVVRRSSRTFTTVPVGAREPRRRFRLDALPWLARIVWASQ